MASSNVTERLPETVKPDYYQLTLMPNLSTLDFKGKVAIRIKVLEKTNKIILHSLDLNIENVELISESDNIKPKSTLDKSNEVLVLSFKNSVEVDKYNLTINFNGRFKDNVVGIFSYRNYNEGGRSSQSVATCFRPNNARMCFPCWDEPTFKATFEIILITPIKLIPLSNMPIKESAVCGNNQIRHAFEPTPIMSTYLLAVVVGEYEYVEDTSTNILIRVYTPLGKKEKGTFPMELVCRTLSYISKYLSVPYSLPKLDIVVVNNYNVIGEHWGLIICSEDILLSEEQKLFYSKKENLAVELGRAISHQWFSNLVTISWWSDMFLCEGISIYMEHLCANYLFPAFNIFESFVLHNTLDTLDADCFLTSHPLEFFSQGRSEKRSIYEYILYKKTASLIRMLHNHMGDESFRKALHNFLRDYKYKNAHGFDLWKVISESSNVPVEQFVSTWTKQAGYPILSVCTEIKPDKVIIQFDQSRYLQDIDAKTAGYVWVVPIHILISSGSKKNNVQALLDKRYLEITVELTGTLDYISIDPEAIGFYRTSYSYEMWDNFHSAIEHNLMSPMERLKLIDNMFSMVKSGLKKTSDVLSFMIVFKNETNYAVWLLLLNILFEVRTIFSNAEFKDCIKKYQWELLEPIYNQLGWEAKADESELTGALRLLIFGNLSHLENIKITNEAKLRFDDHYGIGRKLPIYLMSPVYKIVLMSGFKGMSNKLLKIYHATKSKEEKSAVCESLGASLDPNVLQQNLEFAISDATTHAEGTLVIISIIKETKLGVEIAWKFFTEHFENIFNKFPIYFDIYHIIEAFKSTMVSDKITDEFAKFFEEHNYPELDDLVNLTLQVSRSRASLFKRDQNNVKEFFTKKM